MKEGLLWNKVEEVTLASGEALLNKIGTILFRIKRAVKQIINSTSVYKINTIGDLLIEVINTLVAWALNNQKLPELYNAMQQVTLLNLFCAQVKNPERYDLNENGRLFFSALNKACIK